MEEQNNDTSKPGYEISRQFVDGVKGLAVSESGFVFSPGSGQSFTTNKTGKEIIRLVQQGMAFPQLCEVLQADYEVGKLPLKREVERYLAQLEQAL